MATYIRSSNLVRSATKTCFLQALLRRRHTIPMLTALPSQQARSLCRSIDWKYPQNDRQKLQQTEAINCEEDPYKVEAEKCILCKYQVPVSYKNVQLLSQFVSPNTGRIFGRHITKLCEAQHHRVTKAIKRAIQMGFMPNQYRSTQFLKDPSLYDVRYTGSNVIGQYSKLPDSNISEEELLEAQQRRSDEDEKTTKS
ncbi:28S ribosomal protein S18c, mitochondrial-like [Lytechinus variegatus]|uniref:28S ribosomal protein S18c, mitochondrial-like n=1 Tax=Lytechinus variegatus TaxID=7654 RepID=UPI001BB200B6|nr:28S ribosomal protein S18c, mitochondrial-like [Lytechinus variegatus]